MKRKIKSMLSVVAALCFIISCTACQTVDSGADIAEDSVENININESAIDDSVIDEEIVLDEAPLNITKDQLYYRCMNSMEFLGHVSGDISVQFSPTNPTIFRGNINHDFVNGKYFTYLESIDANDHDNCFQILTTYNDSNVCHALNDNRLDGFKHHEISRDDMCPKLNKSLLTKANVLNPDDKASIEATKAKGEAVITSIDQLSEEQINGTYGGDPTGDHVLGAFYIPQEMSMGYLKNFDMWDITDYKDFQGRSCAVVQGKAEPEYGSRFNVETFEILVDQATGVWMQFEGYDADGNVMQYVYSENVCFDDDTADVPTYKEEYAEGYEELDMNAVNQANIDETIRKMNAEAEKE